MINHDTSFRLGEDYLFCGLGNSPKIDDSDRRIIHILGVSVRGRLSFRIDSPNERGKHLFDIAYSEALLLVSEGIWQEYRP